MMFPEKKPIVSCSVVREVMFTKWRIVFHYHLYFYSVPPLNSIDLHVTRINNLLNFTNIKSYLSIFVTIPLETMENTIANQIEVLVRKLGDAERRAKALKLEVRQIRQDIARLQQSLYTTQNSNVTTALPGSISNGISASSSTVDGPLTNKRPHSEESEQSQNKRLRESFNKEGEYIVVYTDGACENNGRPNARAGVGVWFGDGHYLNISKPADGRATNNNAEIQACIEALRVMKDHGGTKAKIFTDSEFTINCMTKWIRNWKINMWKTAKGGPVKNKVELQELDKLVNSFLDVKWVHVAGHNGIRGNEEADKLAREGALKYKPSS